MSEERRVWAVTTVWYTDTGRPIYEHEVVTEHPLYLPNEWSKEFDGNNDSRLLWWTDITADLAADPDLARHVAFALDENGGELSDCPAPLQQGEGE